VCLETVWTLSTKKDEGELDRTVVKNLKESQIEPTGPIKKAKKEEEENNKGRLV